MKNNNSTTISNLFIKDALRTESPITPELINRLTEERTVRLLHSAMGLMTEGAEFLDALKKFIFYGKDLDLTNVKEEIGDSQWYTAIALDEIGNSYEEIWALVIKKLQMRYKKKDFNSIDAIERDLNAEREVLESNESEALIIHWLNIDTSVAICNILEENHKTALNVELVTCNSCLRRLATNREVYFGEHNEI